LRAESEKLRNDTRMIFHDVAAISFLVNGIIRKLDKDPSATVDDVAVTSSLPSTDLK
jgi:hypothetical protein